MSTAGSGGKQKPGVVLDEALQALAAGELELSAEQLASISGLAAAGRRQVQETLQGMDAAARFSFVDRLITVAETSVLYDFSAVCLDCLEDADAAVRALAASGFADDEGRDTLHRLVELARHDPEASVRSEAALALGPAALRAEFDQLQQADRELVVGTLRANRERCDGGARGPGQRPRQRRRDQRGLGSGSHLRCVRVWGAGPPPRGAAGDGAQRR